MRIREERVKKMRADKEIRILLRKKGKKLKKLYKRGRKEKKIYY